MSRPVLVILVLAVLAPAAIARGLNPSVHDEPRVPAPVAAEPAPTPASAVAPAVSQLRRGLARDDRGARTSQPHRTARHRARTKRSAPVVSTPRVQARAPVQRQPAPTRTQAPPRRDTAPAPTPRAPVKPAPHRPPTSKQTGVGTFDDSG